MLRKISIIVLNFLFIKNAFAGAFLSTGAVYSKSKDNSFYMQPQTNINASYGYFLKANNYTLTFQTNRLINKTQNQFIQSKANGKAYELKTRLRADSLLLGYKFKRFNPSIVVSNARLERTLTERKVNNALLYGLNFNYFIDRNISLSTTYIAPNKEFGLVGAGLVSINYLF